MGSAFEDLKKEMNILSYESFNSFLRENSINQGFVDAKGSLILNIDQNVNEYSIANLENTISRLDKKVLLQNKFKLKKVNVIIILVLF